MSCSVIVFGNTFQVRVRENEVVKQVVLAVSCTEQKDREGTHIKGNQGF